MGKLENVTLIVIVVVALVLKFGVIGYMAYRMSQKNKLHMQMLMDMKNKEIQNKENTEQ